MSSDLFECDLNLPTADEPGEDVQAGDDANMVAGGTKEFDGREGAVGDQHNVSIRQPAINMKTDPTLAKIAAQFTKFHIKPDRGAYTWLSPAAPRPRSHA